MIISASYKTDIPTFYGDWFINRLRAGYCKTRNRYTQQVQTVSLLPDDVDGFVFWTKNASPFLGHLQEVRRHGFPFVVQHTINDAPRVLEQGVVDAMKSVEHVHRIAQEYGPKVCVWRYDTILDSSLTPHEYHVETFSRLAKRLAGATDEVVVSFARFYQKTLKHLNEAAQVHAFTWSDPSEEWKRSLLVELSAIAAAYRIRLTICSHPHLIVAGSNEARCVDVERLSEIGGTALSARLKGNRTDCGCYESRDIGEYDTCLSGCVYCYAVQDRRLARERLQGHDPTSEFLFPPRQESRPTRGDEP